MNQNMTMADKIILAASNPNTTKSDLLGMFKYLGDEDKDFAKKFGQISDDDIDLIKKSETVVEDTDREYSKIGDTIEDAHNDSVRIGFYIVCSDNLQKLREVIKKVQKNFQIIY